MERKLEENLPFVFSPSQWKVVKKSSVCFGITYFFPFLLNVQVVVFSFFDHFATLIGSCRKRYDKRQSELATYAVFLQEQRSGSVSIESAFNQTLLVNVPNMSAARHQLWLEKQSAIFHLVKNIKENYELLEVTLEEVQTKELYICGGFASIHEFLKVSNLPPLEQVKESVRSLRAQSNNRRVKLFQQAIPILQDQNPTRVLQLVKRISTKLASTPESVREVEERMKEHTKDNRKNKKKTKGQKRKKDFEKAEKNRRKEEEEGRGEEEEEQESPLEETDPSSCGGNWKRVRMDQQKRANRTVYTFPIPKSSTQIR